MSRTRKGLLLLPLLLLPLPAAGADAPDEASATAPREELPAPAPYELLGQAIAPGEKRTLALAVSETFAGSEVGIPVVAAVGRRPGSTLCLTAGVHGDEVNGIEVVRRLMADLDPERISGVVLAVPIVNPHGFRRGSRYLPDRRDLNRHFPGRRYGSTASRIAHVLFEGVVSRCDRLLDFHTGSLERTNLPHVRGNLDVPGVAALAKGLPGWVFLQHTGQPGTLRRAATDAGIPTLTFEVGGPARLDEDAIQRTLAGLRGLPGLGGKKPHGAPVEIYGRSRWVRVNDGGLLLTRVMPGDLVGEGQLLGVVVDPIASQETEIRAPGPGRVLGMAWSQVVLPGFAAFHLATIDSEIPPPVGEGTISEEHPE